jgi:phytoene dehydrogenase-like protein
VLVLEAQDTIGGGSRTLELTAPGFRHDLCSAIHPAAAMSPFFHSLDLEVEWVESPAALAHPFDDGTALLVERAPETLGPEYVDLLRPALEITPRLLGPVMYLARNPGTAARFAASALRGATSVARRLPTEQLQALFLGVAAHSVLPLDRKLTAGFGLGLLALAHTHGWPFPRGGSQAIADALAQRLRKLGGEIETGRAVTSLRDLPCADTVICDVTPRQLLALGGDLIPSRYRRHLRRWRYGPGVFKLDYALDGPIPWRARDVARAATVHLGGSPAEIVESERAPWQGRHAQKPFVLLAQPSLFDDTRAPAGKHTAWAYCHVPHGSTVDMRPAVEDQIERFAPGFRERILECQSHDTAAMEQSNANLVGGDISAGAPTLARVANPLRYRTPLPWLYICSAATARGPGVHGMCGHYAARAALGRADPSFEG